MIKRTKHEKIQGIQEVLEAHRRFDYDYIPFSPNWKMPDGQFRYRRRGLDRALVAFWRVVLFLFARFLIGFAYGARVIGKKNLRRIKKTGAVSVMNHFSFLDTLFVRQAVGHFRSFHTMGPKNNRTGFGGHVIRHGGMLPFSADLSAARNLNAEIGRLLESGKIVNFYPEQALWTNYQKPRPMKDGAFHYAIKHNVPILPIFCTFKRTKRGKMRHLRIRILPALYADPALSRREKLIDLKSRAQQAWESCYEQAYGKKCVYLPKQKKMK